MAEMENALVSNGVAATVVEEGKVAVEIEAVPARERAFLKKATNLERRAIPWPLLLLPHPLEWQPMVAASSSSTIVVAIDMESGQGRTATFPGKIKRI